MEKQANQNGVAPYEVQQHQHENLIIPKESFQAPEDVYHYEQERFFTQMSESEMSHGEYLEFLQLQNERV